MIGRQINWYRNASEKDNDKEHGTGILVAISPMERNAEGSVVIVDDKGNFVEKTLSLVKMANSSESREVKQQDQIMELTAANLKKDEEIAYLKDQLNSKPAKSVEITKPLINLGK